MQKKTRLAAGLRPDPLQGSSLQRSPNTLAGFKGVGRPDPLGELERSPRPLAVLGGWGPQEGRERKGGNGKGGEGI